MIYNRIDNNFYKPKDIDDNFNWVIIYYFYKPVNNNKD